MKHAYLTEQSAAKRAMRSAVLFVERVLGARLVELNGGVEVAFGASWAVRCGDWEARGDTLDAALGAFEELVLRECDACGRRRPDVRSYPGTHTGDTDQCDECVHRGA